MPKLLRKLAPFICLLSFAVLSEAQLSLQAFPEDPFIELRDRQQLLNFDIAQTNSSLDTLRLIEIGMTAYAGERKLVLRKTVNSDGLSPGIQVVAPSLLPPGQTSDVFNPFYAIESQVRLARWSDRVPDNEFEGKKIKYPEIPAGADDSLGNYVLIDHGDGEFSVLPHMQSGSVLAKAGDKVAQGQPIGKVGFSGDAIFPHVLYSLLSCADVGRCEGVPAYFQRLQRCFGSRRELENHATLPPAT